MNDKETAEHRVRFGVRLSSLTPEVMENILRIYGETAGVRGLPESYPAIHLVSQVNDSLNKGFPAVYRFGSRLTEHSKLYIETLDIKDDERVIGFRFFDNLRRSDSDNLRSRGDVIRREFNERVTQYLKDKGLALESGR